MDYSVKYTGDRRLHVRGVPYYGPNHGRDNHRQFFTSRTDFMLDEVPMWELPPVYYAHGNRRALTGKDPRIAANKVEKMLVGKTLKRWVEDDGVWYDVELDDSPLSDYLLEKAENSMLFASTGGVRSSIELADTGEIKSWLVGELSLIDLEVGNPLKTPANSLAVAHPKAWYLKNLEGGDMTWYDKVWGDDDPHIDESVYIGAEEFGGSLTTIGIIERLKGISRQLAQLLVMEEIEQETKLAKKDVREDDDEDDAPVADEDTETNETEPSEEEDMNDNATVEEKVDGGCGCGGNCENGTKLTAAEKVVATAQSNDQAELIAALRREVTELKTSSVINDYGSVIQAKVSEGRMNQAQVPHATKLAAMAADFAIQSEKDAQSPLAELWPTFVAYIDASTSLVASQTAFGGVQVLDMKAMGGQESVDQSTLERMRQITGLTTQN